MNGDPDAPLTPLAPRRTRGWLGALLVYAQPRMLSMLALGFSSGLPFMLIYSTLSAWLRQSGIERATIGMLSWVGLVYTLKFLWAPVVDRLRLPIIGPLLGQRRSWMLLAQSGIAAALMAISGSDPKTQVGHMAVLALLLAFAAATQDVAVDAWRIESAPVREQGAMAAAYQLGYRLAILVGSGWCAMDRGRSGLGTQLLDHGRAGRRRRADDAAGARTQAHRAADLGADRTARD